MKSKTLSLAIIIFLFFSGCKSRKFLNKVFAPPSPHEKYADALVTAGLDQSALGMDWLYLAKRSLADSLIIDLPYVESGYFASTKANVVSYIFKPGPGRKIIITWEYIADKPLKIFGDVFEIAQGKNPSLLISASIEKNQIEFESEDNIKYLIRLQPELLRSCNYTLKITTEPVLSFPVKGKNNRDIGSYWGAARDGGSRKHEGIDIMAPRRTPAIAASDGIISNVGDNRLGGKIVFLYDHKRNFNLYYAHLDSQLVGTGKRVKRGDTIGLIGNTGNAKTTAPHLHFGIYTSRRAIDPFPYVYQTDKKIEYPKYAGYTGKWTVTMAKSAALKKANFKTANTILKLEAFTPVFIQAVDEHFAHVLLPDSTQGFLLTTELKDPENLSPLKNRKMLNPIVYERPDTNAVIMDRNLLNPVLLGQYKNFGLIKVSQNTTGWVRLK